MANIIPYIEQAIHGIEAERDQEIADIKANVMREKVTPKNTEIDDARDLAIQELQIKLDTDLSSLQEKFEKERQEIIDASEKQKRENADRLIRMETASISLEYDKKLSELKRLIGA